MPWKNEWVKPDVAFRVAIELSPGTWRDRNVYHAYKEDDYYNRLNFWYTLHDGTPETNLNHTNNRHGIFDFDIREFPTYDESWDHHRILQTAIDTNLCTIEDIFIHTEKAHNVSHDH